MKLIELVFEMVHLKRSETGLGHELTLTRSEVYGKLMKHAHTPRVKINTSKGDFPLTIPQKVHDNPEIPKSIKNPEVYLKTISKNDYKEILNFIYIFRKILTKHYYGEISDEELKNYIIQIKNHTLTRTEDEKNANLNDWKDDWKKEKDLNSRNWRVNKKHNMLRIKQRKLSRKR
jgi:hypothetical protein